MGYDCVPYPATFRPMIEPKELTEARDRLARAEMDFAAKHALYDLESGLALLQEVVDGRDSRSANIARTVGATYATKVHDSVRASLARDANIPEPHLEHLFNLLRIFDQSDLDLPADSRDLKIALARRLIDCYLEGHSTEQKEAAVKEILEIARS